MTENNNGSDKPKFRQISDEELKQILEDHKKWLKLDGKGGKKADLSKSDLSYRNLRKSNLKRANLQKANLIEANLQKAYLRKANLQKASLWDANLQKAGLDGANFQKASLWDANLQKASLWHANLKKAELRRANLQDSTLRDSDLEKTDVFGIQYKRSLGEFQGIRVSTCYGSERFKRFAQDQAYIDELAEGKWWESWLYYLWHIFADCGRTPFSWICWSILFAIYFGINFFWMGKAAFIMPENTRLAWEPVTLIYYSTVTFTTLGFGDITPNTTTAAMWVMAEVILGYIMLGGLISILATIIARRS